MIHLRPAGPLDAAPLAAFLSGFGDGPQALTATALADRMRADPAASAWHLAEDATGTLLGLQWIHPAADLPATTCAIATFLRRGNTDLAAGSALFERSRAAAARLGYRVIEARIRNGNAGGLAYYQSRGFEPIPSAAGHISARYEL